MKKIHMAFLIISGFLQCSLAAGRKEKSWVGSYIRRGLGLVSGVGGAYVAYKALNGFSEYFYGEGIGGKGVAGVVGVGGVSYFIPWGIEEWWDYTCDFEYQLQKACTDFNPERLAKAVRLGEQEEVHKLKVSTDSYFFLPLGFASQKIKTVEIWRKAINVALESARLNKENTSFKSKKIFINKLLLEVHTQLEKLNNYYFMKALGCQMVGDTSNEMGVLYKLLSKGLFNNFLQVCSLLKKRRYIASQPTSLHLVGINQNNCKGFSLIRALPTPSDLFSFLQNSSSNKIKYLPSSFRYLAECLEAKLLFKNERPQCLYYYLLNCFAEGGRHFLNNYEFVHNCAVLQGLLDIILYLDICLTNCKCIDAEGIAQARRGCIKKLDTQIQEAGINKKNESGNKLKVIVKDLQTSGSLFWRRKNKSASVPRLVSFLSFPSLSFLSQCACRGLISNSSIHRGLLKKGYIW